MVHEISPGTGEPAELRRNTGWRLGLSDDRIQQRDVKRWRISKIGHTNGKQFAKRLQLFGITEEQLRAALEAVLENEDKHE